MSTNATPDPLNQVAAFELVLCQTSKAVEDLYRMASSAADSPAVAAHVRQLAEILVSEALDSLRRWPK